MSRRKRPGKIEQTKESVLMAFHIAIDEITEQENRGELALGVDEPERILTGDLDYE